MQVRIKKLFWKLSSGQGSKSKMAKWSSLLDRLPFLLCCYSLWLLLCRIPFSVYHKPCPNASKRWILYQLAVCCMIAHYSHPPLLSCHTSWMNGCGWCLYCRPVHFGKSRHAECMGLKQDLEVKHWNFWSVKILTLVVDESTGAYVMFPPCGHSCIWYPIGI